MGVYGATDGAVPYLLKRVLDDVFGNHNKQMLWNVVWLILAFAVIRGSFGFLERYFISSVGLSIVRDIRNDIVKHLLKLSDTFFQRETTGSILTRISNDTLQVRTVLTDSMGAFLRDSIRVVALLSVAFYLDPWLGLFALIGFPLGILPVLKFGKKVRKLSRQGQDTFGSIVGFTQELIQGQRVVKMFCKEEAEAARFAAENTRLTETLIRAEKTGAMAGPTNEVFASAAIAGVIVYGGLSVMGGVRTQGDFIAFITAMFLLYDPLKKLGRMSTNYQTGISASERIFALLDTDPEVRDLPNAKDIKLFRPRIEFKDVSYTYQRSEESKISAEYALRNINLTIEPGEKLALVGMSGGGKSTLVGLLPRFYDVSSGNVLIDGVDIRNFTLRSLRQQVAYVSQHIFLFNDTIFSNIAYGREGATAEEVRAAAHAAYADEFIDRLPNGFNTVLGEGGFSVSGGERARISIARAILKDAPILILDEATASLDSQAEREVTKAIENLIANKTVIVIAHRLSTIANVDRIAVLSRGKLVELGTHDELFTLDGEYAKLHRLQQLESNYPIEPASRQIV
jgi:subfamily B ATP-binding cassette protein MsbA